jgi:hypothetical protein
VCYGHGGELLICQALYLSPFFSSPLDLSSSSAEGYEMNQCAITWNLEAVGK